MSKPMNKANETKTLIVTETVSYEFTVPASMAEDRDSLKCFFAGHRDPWRDADFAAVLESEFEIQLVVDDSKSAEAALQGRQDDTQGAREVLTLPGRNRDFSHADP